MGGGGDDNYDGSSTFYSFVSKFNISSQIPCDRQFGDSINACLLQKIENKLHMVMISDTISSQ